MRDGPVNPWPIHPPDGNVSQMTGVGLGVGPRGVGVGGFGVGRVSTTSDAALSCAWTGSVAAADRPETAETSTTATQTIKPLAIPVTTGVRTRPATGRSG